MKRHLLLFLTFIVVTTYSMSQDTNVKLESTFFIQSMFDITDQNHLKLLENQLHQNPMVKMCRFESKTKTVLIITNPLNNFSEENLMVWLGEYSAKISCIQIGVFGKDKMISYPILNCN
jgi:hypothetical protein